MIKTKKKKKTLKKNIKGTQASVKLPQKKRTKVCDLNRAGFIEQQIARLEIRMHNAFAVQVRNS